jgi:hypothetical protein
MKKLLPLFLLASLQSRSQSVSLTQAVFQPVIGDTSRHYVLDTSWYGSGLNAAFAGSNVLWEYSHMVTTSVVVTSAYVDPTSVPSASDYPGCSVVQKNGPLYTYYKNASTPSVQTEFMGVTSSSLNMNLTNTAVNMRYPFSFGSVITDAFSGSFTFSLSGTTSGNATVTADATGTLIIPGGTVYPNVLRVKSYQSTAFTAFPISGSMKQTNYSWYISGQKFPVMTINYQSFSIAGGSPTLSAQGLGNKSNFIIGVKEQQLDNSSVQFYPNPVSSELVAMSTLAFLKQEVVIYSITGQELKRGTAGKIDCSDLTKGIYIAELNTDKGIIRKKIIKD